MENTWIVFNGENGVNEFFDETKNKKKSIEAMRHWYLLKQKLIITNMKIFQVWLERFRKLCLVLT